MTIEINDNGIIGFDYDGIVLFNNTTASKITKVKEIKGKSIFDILDNLSTENIKSFMTDEKEKTVTIKLEISENDKFAYYDAAIFKITNGKTFYVMFFINCLENVVFKSSNCPLRNNCPFNKKCSRQEVLA